MKYLFEYDELKDFSKENNEILDDVRHYRSNLAQYKRYWDNRMNKDSYPNKHSKYIYPQEREETDNTYPYQTFGGLGKLTDREKKNLDDNEIH